MVMAPLPAVIVGHPRTLKRGDWGVEVGDHRCGCESLFQCRGVDERLECGAGLPARLCRAIEPALVEAPAAHHGANVTGRGIERDERGLQRLGRWGSCFTASTALLDLGERPCDLGFRRLLHGRIERRIDLQTTLIDTFPSETLQPAASAPLP
jgi:hypothetical protein